MKHQIKQMEQTNNTCPTCGSEELIYDYNHGEIVCAVCGTVVSENLVDPGPEWRDVQGARTGPPLKITFELITEIGNRDARGRPATKEDLAKWMKRRYFEKRAIKVAYELKRMSAMGVSEACIERALGIFRTAYEKGLTRGQPFKLVTAAVLYMACRMLKTPRPAAEIARYIGVKKHDILRVYNIIAAGLKPPKPDVIDYVRMVAAKLKLDAQTTSKAIEIARNIKGMAPHVAAAVAVYLALGGGGKISMSEIAEAAGIVSATLRNGLARIGVRRVDKGMIATSGVVVVSPVSSAAR